MDRLAKDDFFRFELLEDEYWLDDTKKSIASIKEYIKEYLAEIEPSDCELALEMARVCAWNEINPPKWVVQTIADAWSKYTLGYSQSDLKDNGVEVKFRCPKNMEEAFDVRRETSKSRLARMERLFYSPLIYQLASHYKLAGAPFDDSLWELLHKKHIPLGGSTIRKYYFWYVKEAGVKSLGDLEFEVLDNSEQEAKKERVKPDRKNFRAPIFNQIFKLK